MSELKYIESKTQYTILKTFIGGDFQQFTFSNFITPLSNPYTESDTLNVILQVKNRINEICDSKKYAIGTRRHAVINNLVALMKNEEDKFSHSKFIDLLIELNGSLLENKEKDRVSKREIITSSTRIASGAFGNIFFETRPYYVKKSGTTKESKLTGEFVVKIIDELLYSSLDKLNLDREILISQLLSCSTCGKYYIQNNGVSIIDHRPAIYYQKMDGDVSSLIQKTITSNFDEFVTLQENISNALITNVQMLHSMNIIHMDLKFDNMLFRKEKGLEKPEIVLSDFGLAQFYGLSKYVRSGTRGYVAPSNYFSSKIIKSVDLYAVLIMLNELYKLYPLVMLETSEFSEPMMVDYIKNMSESESTELKSYIAIGITKFDRKINKTDLIKYFENENTQKINKLILQGIDMFHNNETYEDIIKFYLELTTIFLSKV